MWQAPEADGSNRMKIMKKILVFIVAALLAAACGKKEADVNVDGSWHLTSVSSLENGTVDIWLRFGSGNVFTIWQKSAAEDRYSVFTGNYSVNGKKISGKYSDGTSWGDSYEVAISSDGGTLTLTASGSGEVSSYAKSDVPESVTDNTYSTKSGEIPAMRWL